MIHKSEEKLTASPYRSQNPIMLSLRGAHACCHEPSFCANTSWSESWHSSELNLQMSHVGPTPHYGWRLWSQSQGPVWRVPSTPEDYCYLVCHAMKQPWQLNWIKQCWFPLHERRVSDGESSTVTVRDEFSVLLESWRKGWLTGGVGGCAVGVLWGRMALYHTHQLHPLSVVDIYLQPGYRSMLEM